MDALEVVIQASVVMFAVAGQVITGSSLSVTKTVCVHEAVLPLASVADQVTVVEPTA